MQTDLFPVENPVVHQLKDASIVEYPALHSAQETERYFDLLTTIIPWKQSSIRIAGKLIPIPRLQCWIADSGLFYTYSGLSLQRKPWPEPVLELKNTVERVSGHRFNAVLANYYRDGNDSVAWHSDDEPELGPNPVVASLSFGAQRTFELKHKSLPELEKVRLMLCSGSLLIMGDTVQNNWLHQVPKEKHLKNPRINLTFRLITD
ncbi:MAG: alpha-ketoglutarate-dependent dioxygenase AlkB [Gammaproteobacteria bacterium]|nr:alpha-ketoglutarate-dependent dioxygenase AlkB [Gammaproteobacteria bacterium]